MSDRPEASRPTSDTARGWFVPKNAMTEQQIAAMSPKVSNPVPMPANTTPQNGGEWYVPEQAAQRAAALTIKPDGNDGTPEKPPTANEPVSTTENPPADDKDKSVPGKPATGPLPQGAALSSEVDYSNYIPGKGFVTPATGATPGTTSAAPADE